MIDKDRLYLGAKLRSWGELTLFIGVLYLGANIAQIMGLVIGYKLVTLKKSRQPG